MSFSLDSLSDWIPSLCLPLVGCGPFKKRETVVYGLWNLKSSLRKERENSAVRRWFARKDTGRFCCCCFVCSFVVWGSDC